MKAEGQCQRTGRCCTAGFEGGGRGHEPRNVQPLEPGKVEEPPRRNASWPAP